MKHPNNEPIDPLIRQQQKNRLATDIDGIINDQRDRDMHFAARYQDRMLPGAEEHYDVVTGVSKDSVSGEIVNATDYVLPVDPNKLATLKSEAAWNGLPKSEDSPEFKAFAASLKTPAGLALNNVTHVDFVHPDTNRAVEQSQDATEIAS